MNAAIKIESKIGLKRKRVLDAINHRIPDRVPVDFGGGPTTGMHVSCVAALRDHYGLEKRIVKICEPFQMLGQIDDDLKEAIGIDTTAMFGRTNMFGFENKDWKRFVLNGLEVLVPEGFRTAIDPEKGGTLIYPRGDTSAPPSAIMPEGGYFFDATIRQEAFDANDLRAEDNMDEYTLLTEQQLDEIEEDARRLNTGEYAVFASLTRTALGDISMVPAVDLPHPSPKVCATSPNGTC